MGFCTEIAGHAAHHYFIDPALTELQNQIIVFRTVKFVRSCNDDIRAFVDIRLVEIQPVGTRTFKSLTGQLSPALKHTRVMHQFLDRPLKKPLVIVFVIIVWRDEYQHTFRCRYLKDAAEVLYRTVLLYILSKSSPT